MTNENEDYLLFCINKFLLSIYNHGVKKKNLEILDIGIDTLKMVSVSSASKLQINLDKLLNSKFSIHNEMKDFDQAMEDCKERLKVTIKNDTF